MKTLTVGRANFNAVAYSADGRWLVSLNSGRQVRFWDLTSFKQQLWFRLPAPTWQENLTLGLWGDRLVLKMHLWDIGPAWEYLRRQHPRDKQEALWRGVELREVEQSSHQVLAGPDGELLPGVVRTYSPRYHTHVQVWDREGHCRKKLPAPRGVAYPEAVAVQGRVLAISCGKSAVLFDLERGEEVGRLEHALRPNRIVFSPDGRLLASCAGRRVWLWDLATRQVVARSPAFRKYAEALAFHPEGKLLAGGSGDGEVRLWDGASLKPLARLDWDVGAIHGLAFSPDGMTVAAAAHKNAIVIWDLE
jgi:WD40 repeat protein